MPKKCTRRKKGERFGSARHERESGGTTALQIPPAGDCHSLSSLRIRGLEAHRFLFFFVEPSAIKRRLSRFIKMRVNKSSAAWRQFRKKERVAARMHASKKKKKSAHSNRDHTRRSHEWVTDRGSSVHWLKPHVTRKRDHNNVSHRPQGSRTKVGHGLHAARGLRDGLCNQEVPFLLATLLNVGQSWAAKEAQFFCVCRARADFSKMSRRINWFI